MVGIRVSENDEIWFDQNKYHISFNGMTVQFSLKKEFYPTVNRQTKIVIDYADKKIVQTWVDGSNAIENFEGMI